MGDEDLNFRFFDVAWNKKLGKELIKKMEPKLQDGMIFVDSHDWIVYLVIIIVTTLFFFLAFPIWRKMFELCKLHEYEKRDDDAKIRYVGLWVANTHHLPVSIYLIVAFITACSKGSEFPIPG